MNYKVPEISALVDRCINFRTCIICLLTLFALFVTYAPAYAKVKFENVWLEHGVYQSGVKGMTVHAHFTIDGMKGKDVTAAAWIKDESGEYLNSVNGGTLGVLRELDVTYENSVWKDLTFFIPYDNMVLKSGEHKYYAWVSLHANNECLSFSRDVEFTGTGSGSNRKGGAKREMLANGYVDKVENADGSITSTIVTKCNICSASGRCNLCSGQGGLWGGYGKYRSYHICNSCGGGGRCKYCKGSGDNVLVTTYYPATNETVGYDLFTGNMVSSSSNYGNSGKSNSNKKSDCSNCNNTGIDMVAYTDANFKPRAGGYTHSSGGKCRYCGKYEWHQHVYCPFCRADKY